MQLRAQLFFFCFMIDIGTKECSKLSFFSAFSRLGPVPEAFGQVKEWLIVRTE